MSCKVNVWEPCDAQSGDGTTTDASKVPLSGTVEGLPITGVMTWESGDQPGSWEQRQGSFYSGANTMMFLADGADAGYVIQTRGAAGTPYYYSFIGEGAFRIQGEDVNHAWNIQHGTYFGVPDTLGIGAIRGGVYQQNAVAILTSAISGFTFNIDGSCVASRSTNAGDDDYAYATKDYVLAQIPGTGGQDNTSSNVGSGANLAKNKSGIDLPFRTLTTDNTFVNMVITENTDEVDISLSQNLWINDIVVGNLATFGIAPQSNADAVADNELVRMSQYNNLFFAFVALAGDQTVAGKKTFSTCPVSNDLATESNELITLGQALGGFAQATTYLTAGSGLTGGGSLAGDRSFSVNNTVLRTSGGQVLVNESTIGYNAATASNNSLTSKGYVIIMTSDERLKENIVDADLYASYRLLDTIPVREFDWNELSDRVGHEYGFIAQDFEREAPELTARDSQGMLGIKQRDLTARLWAQNKIQKDKIADLELRLARIEEYIGG